MTQSPLQTSYQECKRLSRSYGSTYYWAAAILPPPQRKHVFALYAFCRYADDIVDVGNAPTIERQRALDQFENQFFNDLDRGYSQHSILAAVVHTAYALDLPAEYFERFMRSMRMDLRVRTYDTFEDLLEYMEGSAAVIGEMMLPVLQPISDDARYAARQLGIAFQLTNFLRDVGEDLDRDRIYIPQETLQKFGADPWQRRVTPEWVDVMQHEIDRTRSFYAEAAPGLALLRGRPQACVMAAHRLYGGILDRIEQNSYDVFTQRARVPRWQKLAAARTALRPV